MTEEPTPEELARAKRYIESVPFEVAEFPAGNWIAKGGPALFRHVWGPTRDDAAASLLRAVVEMLASVGPMIREELSVCECGREKLIQCPRCDKDPERE